MRTRLSFLLLILLLAVAVAWTASAEGEDSWTGEVLDLSCYVAQGAHGGDHADCAKSCVKNGQPMGLLTADDTVILLAASHQNGAAYETLKDLAGAQAEVQGTLAERDGMKVLTVTGAKAAG